MTGNSCRTAGHRLLANRLVKLEELGARRFESRLAVALEDLRTELLWIRVLVGLFGYMLCSSGEEGGCEWSVGCASPIHHESRPSPPNIHQHP